MTSKLKQAGEAVAKMGDSSKLSDVDRNAPEQTILAALDAGSDVVTVPIEPNSDMLFKGFMATNQPDNNLKAVYRAMIRGFVGPDEDKPADWCECNGCTTRRKPCIKDLGRENQLVVPGMMRCAKCEFGLTRRVLYTQSGNVGAGDNKTEPCPNGCGPLWPVTWKDYADDLEERLMKELEEKQSRPDVSEIRAALENSVKLLRDYYEYAPSEDPDSKTLKVIAEGEKALETLKAWDV